MTYQYIRMYVCMYVCVCVGSEVRCSKVTFETFCPVVKPLVCCQQFLLPFSLTRGAGVLCVLVYALYVFSSSFSLILNFENNISA